MSIVTPTTEDVHTFHDILSKCDTKPAILSLVPDYSTSYVPKCFLDAFPKSLSLLHQPEYVELEYHMLLDVCDSVNVEIREEMAVAVEKETRLQSNSKLWFKYQAGRITA